VRRIVNLIKSVRQLGTIFPGDKIKVIGEKPATYLGALEEGDIQVDNTHCTPLPSGTASSSSSNPHPSIITSVNSFTEVSD
jgi:hypothetical protein